MSARAVLGPLTVGLCSANSAGSQFGGAVQSFIRTVILEILEDGDKLNLPAALRTLVSSISAE